MSARLAFCSLYTGVTYNPGFTVDVQSLELMQILLVFVMTCFNKTNLLSLGVCHLSANYVRYNGKPNLPPINTSEKTELKRTTCIIIKGAL